MKEPILIKHSQAVLSLMQRWKNRRQENFLSITLNGVHEVIKIHHITRGLINRTIVHPRECFYPTIKDLAAAVIFVHNHPSGSATASQEDDEITKRLCMTAQIMGINLLDHIIITPKDNYYSYRQENKLSDKYKVYELDAFVKSLSRDYGQYSNTYKEQNNEQPELNFN